MAHVLQYTLARLVLVAFKLSMQNLRVVRGEGRNQMAGVLPVRVLGWGGGVVGREALHNSTDTHYISQSGNTREVRTQENGQQPIHAFPVLKCHLDQVDCLRVCRERDGGEEGREKTRTIGPHWSTIAQHAVSVATQRQPRRDIPAVEIVDPHKTCLCSITLLGIVSVTKNKK